MKKYGVEATLKRSEEELKLAGYSRATVRTYHSAMRRFLNHASKPSSRLNHDDVRKYMLHLTPALVGGDNDGLLPLVALGNDLKEESRLGSLSSVAKCPI